MAIVDIDVANLTEERDMFEVVSKLMLLTE
jgi:hypothetical protein